MVDRLAPVPSGRTAIGTTHPLPPRYTTLAQPGRDTHGAAPLRRGAYLRAALILAQEEGVTAESSS